MTKPKPVCPRPECGGTTHQRCIAHKQPSRGGGPCNSFPMKGQNVCDRHGGKAPQNLAMANQRTAAAAMNKAVQIFGIPRQVDPAQGLIEEYWRTAGLVSAYEQVVTGLPVDDLIYGVVERSSLAKGVTPPPVGDAGESSPPPRGEGEGEGEVETRTVRKMVPNVWLRLFNEERDRYARLGAEITRLGLAARRDEYIRAQVEVFAGVLLHPDLALSVEQRQAAGRLLRGLGTDDTSVIDGTVVDPPSLLPS